MALEACDYCVQGVDRAKTSRNIVMGCNRCNEVMGSLRLSLQEMKTQLAILRHCELIRAHKENDRIYLATFDREQGRG